MMRKSRAPTAIAACLLFSVVAPHPATAITPGEPRGIGAVVAPFIETRAPTLAPFSHVRFCLENPDDCRVTSGTALVQLDKARRSELLRINREVNLRIRPINDAPGAVGDVWQADVTSGDCEDFALTKRRALVAAGWPAASLRLAVARTRSGEGHAVLIVTTSDGDLVLDNRTTTIRVWNRTDLRLLKIQSAANPHLWFSV